MTDQGNTGTSIKPTFQQQWSMQNEINEKKEEKCNPK